MKTAVITLLIMFVSLIIILFVLSVSKNVKRKKDIKKRNKQLQKKSIASDKKLTSGNVSEVKK